VDDVPNRARAIAAEMPAFAGADDVVKVVLAAYSLVVGPAGVQPFLLGTLKSSQRLIEQQMDVGQLGRGADLIPSNRDVTIGLAVEFAAHAVCVGHSEFAMQFVTGRQADDANAFA